MLSAIDRDELLELRDRLWKLGAITIQGCLWLDEILGVNTYQRNRGEEDATEEKPEKE